MKYSRPPAASAAINKAGTTTLFFMAVSLTDKKLSHGIVLGVVDEPVAGAAAGIVGAKLDPAVPAKGDTFVIGTAGAALTPRFPIS